MYPAATALDLLVQEDGLTAYVGSFFQDKKGHIYLSCPFLLIRLNLPFLPVIFLFDIGRVLLDFDFKSSLAQLMPADTRNPDERLDRLLHRKDELEAGLISAESYTRWVLDILGSHATDLAPVIRTS